MPRICRYNELVKPYLKNITEWIVNLTEGQIAKRLGVSTTTFKAYKDKYPELQEALKAGQQNLVEELRGVMKQAAKGYFKTNEKTTYTYIGDELIKKTVEENKQWYPPNMTAAHLLLKNNDDTWHNDDAETIKQKREALKISQQKADNVE